MRAAEAVLVAHAGSGARGGGTARSTSSNRAGTGGTTARPARAPASGSGGSNGNAGAGGIPEMPDPVECETALDYSEMFIFDIQTHRVETAPGVYRSFLMSLPQGRCGMGVPACYSKDEYARTFFLESDTTVTVLSGIPATDGNNPLTNAQIAESRDYVNAMAQETQRVVSTRWCCRTTTTTQQLDGMASIVTAAAPVGAWKCYTPWGPGDGVTGFWLDDPKIGIPFIEQGRMLGVKTFACHKGLPLPGFDNNYGDPKDIGVVAKMFPDCKFIAYHSAYQFGNGDESVGYTMGSKDGVNSLVTACIDNGIMPGGNIYGELGSTWNNDHAQPDAGDARARQAAQVPRRRQRRLGHRLHVVRLAAAADHDVHELPDGPEIREAEGYPDLTPAIKAKILGLNAAKVYGIDRRGHALRHRRERARPGQARARRRVRPLPLGVPASRASHAARFPAHVAFHRAAKTPG